MQKLFQPDDREAVARGGQGRADRSANAKYEIDFKRPAGILDCARGPFIRGRDNCATASQEFRESSRGSRALDRNARSVIDAIVIARAPWHTRETVSSARRGIRLFIDNRESARFTNPEDRVSADGRCEYRHGFVFFPSLCKSLNITRHESRVFSRLPAFLANLIFTREFATLI